MKAISRSVTLSPGYAKIFAWGKLVTITGVSQAVIQVVGFVSGILIIRLLPTHEYALYTLANTMLGTMTLLADGGISTGVMSQGGAVWMDREKVGSVLATGLYLRKKFSIVSLLVAIPALVFLLQQHQASWLMTFLIILSIIPSFYITLSSTLLEIVPKLRQEITPLQLIQVKSNAARLVLTGLTIFIFPYSFLAIAVNGIPLIWANKNLKKIAASFANFDQKSNPVVQTEIIRVVKRLLPDSIYYCISCQFAIWLISFFGSTAAVAQIGALSRFAVALNLFTVFFATLITPRFARLELNANLIIKRFIQILAGLVVLSLSIVSVVWFFSAEILWILGREYSMLTTEIVLMMLGKCISLVAGSAFLLCSSKGWVINPLLSIPIGIISIGIGVTFIDISSLQGIFKLDIFVASVQLLMHLGYALFRIRELRASEN